MFAHDTVTLSVRLMLRVELNMDKDVSLVSTDTVFVMALQSPFVILFSLASYITMQDDLSELTFQVKVPPTSLHLQPTMVSGQIEVSGWQESMKSADIGIQYIAANKRAEKIITELFMLNFSS